MISLEDVVSSSFVVFAQNVLYALTDQGMTIIPSTLGTQAVSCSYKAASGFLYPLERGFIFVHKPPLHIRFEEVAFVNFARSQGPGKAFDFEVELKTVRAQRRCFQNVVSVI